MNREECLKQIKKIEIGYLATYDCTQKMPRVRPIDMGTQYNGLIYFSTFANTNKVKELESFKNVEVYFGNDDGQIRVNGEVNKVTDLTIRKKFLDDNKVMKDMFRDENNDDFVLYSINPILFRIMGSNDSEYNIVR